MKKPASHKTSTVVQNRDGPYIIAEAGVNHNGRLDEALRLVDLVQGAGAQAVKFQIFRADTLAGSHAPCTSYQTAATGDQQQHDLLESLELSEDEFRRIQDHCRAQDLDFLATPFSAGDLKFLLTLSPSAIKIASGDLNNFPLLEAAVAGGLPLFVSSGASTLDEIDQTIDFLIRYGAQDRSVLMHCVSSYPTSNHQAGLSTIAMLQRRTGMKVGYSDHTESIESGGFAVACGAVVLEKHVTRDRRQKGPDHSFSLEPDMFRQYVDLARLAWEMLGQPRWGVAECEQEVRRLARKSIVAGAAIRAGEVLSDGNLALKRPGGGLEPAQWSKVLGKKALRDIPPDVQIQWDMVG